MTDRSASFTVGIGGDDADLRAVFIALKGRVRSEVAELEAITRKATLFEGLEDRTKAAADALSKARDAAAKLSTQLDAVKQSGGKASEELVTQMRAAETEVRRATLEFNRSVDAISKLQRELTKAGVDTRNLAAEQERLAVATKAAAVAAQDQANKQALGFRSIRDTQAEANRLIAAYNALRTSGNLSFGEISVAQARLTQGLAELRTQSVGVGAALSEMRGRLIAFTAAFAGVAAAINESASNFRAFTQQIAAIDSIAGVGKARIDELATGVRELSRRLGVDAVQSAKALYEILSSGIAPDNALAVLEQATKAAIAGITDVATAAKVGVSVLNAYSLEVTQLGHVYDVLFQTVKDGVITFPELAASIGDVLPVARAARVPIEEIGAAFVVLTQRGIGASEAGTSIARAIRDLSAPAPEAAQRMAALGIELKGFVGTIEQIAAKKLPLSILTDIVPDIRSQRAILQLADAFAVFRDEIEAGAKAADTMQAAYKKMAATPQAAVDRFNASVKDLSLAVGEFVTGSSGLVQSLTAIANAFNDLDAKTKSTVLSFTAMTAGLVAAVLIVRTLAVPINLLAGALAAAGTAGAGAAGGITAAAVATTGLQAAVAGFLGFKFGEQLYQNFAPVRLIGDLLGVIAGRIDNLATFAFKALTAAVTLNAGAFAAAKQQYLANSATLDRDWSDAVSGATERSRQLAAAQEQASNSFGRATTAAKTAAAALDGDLSRALGAVKTQADAADANVTKVQQRLDQLATGLRANVAQIEQAMTQALANVNAGVQQQIQALATAQEQNLGAVKGAIEALQKSELDNVAATIEIQRKGAADRLAVLQKFITDAKAAFETEAKARLDIAKTSGQKVAAVEQEIALARVAQLQKYVDAFRTHVAQLQAEYKGHLDKIKELELSRIALNAGIEDKIRELRRAGLTAYEVYADRVKEIDALLAKAQLEAFRGNLTQAELFANKAISLTDRISGEVKDDSGVIVNAIDASRTATDRLTKAGEILNGVIDKRVLAERTGAEESKRALEAAERDLNNLQTQLKTAQDTAAKGIKLQIEHNIADVSTQLKTLSTEIEGRERVLKIKADLEDAKALLKQLQTDIENGITVNLQARIELIEAALAKVKEKAPAIDLDVSPALKSIDRVAEAIRALGNVRVQLDISSTVVQQRARGGFVGEPVQGFAGGGFAFRKPSWSKVPGAGNTDSVPAALPSGSFVLRKAAGATYGDRFMSMIAGGVQRFASGGSVIGNILGSGSSPTGLLDRLLGAAATPKALLDSLERSGVSLGGDPEIRALKNQATELIWSLINAMGGLPGSSSGQSYAQFLKNVWELILESNTADRIHSLLDPLAQSEQNIRVAIAQAQLFRVPLTYGASTTDKDPLFSRNQPSAQYAQLVANALAARFGPAVKKAGGGNISGGDVVPAMLTPGEWVVPPRRAASLGSSFLQALNSVRFSRADLAAMLMPPSRPVHAFAGGGAVPGARIPEGSSSARAGRGDMVVTINLTRDDLDDVSRIRRNLLPILRDIERRSSGKG